MGKTTIEWTDSSWNPVTGCTKISQGCKFCYAETLYNRFNGAKSFNNVTSHHSRLNDPFLWKPQRVFVNSMSDLFHESVLTSFIDEIMVTMAFTPHITYQVLTKRSLRMMEYMNDPKMPQRILDLMHYKKQFFYPPTANKKLYFMQEKHEDIIKNTTFPLKNVWTGVSVENQEMADERIPNLKTTNSALRFLSCEPLLGYIDLTKHLSDNGIIEWIIIGGESGNQARPMHPYWVEYILLQLANRAKFFKNVPAVFFKQWGSYIPGSDYLSGKKHFAVLDNGNKYKWDYPDDLEIKKVADWNKRNPTVMRKVNKKEGGAVIEGFGSMVHFNGQTLQNFPAL